VPKTKDLSAQSLTSKVSFLTMVFLSNLLEHYNYPVLTKNGTEILYTRKTQLVENWRTALT